MPSRLALFLKACGASHKPRKCENAFRATAEGLGSLQKTIISPFSRYRVWHYVARLLEHPPNPYYLETRFALLVKASGESHRHVPKKVGVLRPRPKSNRGVGAYGDLHVSTVAVLAQGPRSGDAFAQPHFLHGFESRRVQVFPRRRPTRNHKASTVREKTRDSRYFSIRVKIFSLLVAGPNFL